MGSSESSSWGDTCLSLSCCTRPVLACLPLQRWVTGCPVWPVGALRVPPVSWTAGHPVRVGEGGDPGGNRVGLALSLIGIWALRKESFCLVLTRPNTDLSFFTSIC